MLDLGWDKKPNVRILFGRWEDVLDKLEQYDGIFFDTYAEHYDHMRTFHAALPKILKPSGLYSFFNGLAPRCPFFHSVYCKIVQNELSKLGFDTQYMQLPVSVQDKQQWDSEWTGVKNRYWFQRTYYLPIVYWKDDEEEV
jgi:protein arginine N-methyltransferase 2